MASNFQMAGPGQMMPGQQQRPQAQRPPQGQSAATTQIQQVIFQTVSGQTNPNLTGWQANVLIQERISLIFNIIGNLRLASQNQPNSPGLNRMIEIGIKFEKEIFDKSPDKNSYKRQVEQKLEQLLERRNQNQAGLQQTIQQQAQAQAQAQQQQAQQQMMMNQNGMQGQQQRAMNQQPAQQGFQHLQHPMQATPLPGQQPQGMSMGMGNDSLPPNMAQNPHQQFQMPIQQSQQQQQANHQAGGQQPQLSPSDQAIVMELANRLMAQATNEEKNAIRTNLRSRMNPQQLNQYQVAGQDPLIVYYRNQALSRLRADKQARMAQQMAMSQQGQNMQNTAPPMQQQRSMQQSPLNGQSQPPTSMGGNGDFGGFNGSMDSLAAQQQAGGISHESGQAVVPASAAQRNSTPQPGMMGGMPINMNDQRGVANPNNRGQQQNNLLNSQQLQQQRMQQAAQQQSQAQARMTAQAKAQMGLTGQPGGMGNGPMRPQQSSPALPTLNQPLGATPQMGQADPAQMNPSPQFGHPLDPQFAHGNQRQIGSGGGTNAVGINPAMFPGMSREQLQRANTLPPDKLSEMMVSWNEQQRAINANIQAGRPPIPIQGQMHPIQQVAQHGQFNSQTSNPGMNMNGMQRPGQSITTNMTPHQQLLLSEQIARLQQNPLQRPQNMPPNGMGNEQRMLNQMDNVDFPPTLNNNANMPRNVPPEVKKWGQLKLWIQQNPSLAPEVLENLKGLQRLHCQQIMRTRIGQQRAGQQPGNMQISMQNGQGNMSSMPPGVGAPVASMVPNSMQLPGGMPMGPGQIRQPTAQEIQSARQHPRMANLTDDQIRAILMRQMAAQRQQLQQQQQDQLMRNLQMSNHPQMTGPTRPGLPQQIINGKMPNQPAPTQVPPPNKPQPGPEAAASANSAPNANRVRPTPSNARNPAQNSSPAQPANNLKRASSDDPVEVPNPNAPQNSKPAPPQRPQGSTGQGQQGQMQKQASQQGRPTLNSQQVANLDPEARKKYEMNARMAQVSRVPTENAELEKLKMWAQEEMQNAPPLVDVPMNQEMKATVMKMLREIVQPLQNMNKAALKWYEITRDENRARAFFRVKYRLSKQFNDPITMTQHKDTFSVQVKEIEQARIMLNSMIKDLSDRFPRMIKPNEQQPPATSQADVASSQPPQAPTVPLNAANLKEQQQQLDKMHQSSNGRSSQAPAAPTSPQPPFQFGAAKSPPNGVPVYPSSTSRVTRDTLTLPPKKKAKRGNSTPVTGQGTPGSTVSPQVAKAVSPEVKRQPIETKAQPKRALCCSEPECDRHNVGFENEEALRIHTQEEHIKPLENPIQYALLECANTLGLDSQGHIKKQPAPQDILAAAAPKMSTSGSKQGQTPNIKSGNTPAATTPMNRQVSMNRQGSAAGVKPSTPSKATTSKDSSAKLASGQKDTSKHQANHQQETLIDDAWANAYIDPHELLQAFQTFESGAGGAISDMNIYRSITPNDTPESSKDGVSEPNSDISEGVGLDISLDVIDDTWMPFGPSDADTTFDMNNFGVNKEEDMMMFDEEQPPINFQWDDMVDPTAFDKPFSFDTSLGSLYSMNAD
ncbi:hypothetical protein G7Y89_g12805 [Cudoniella acicularis]|uniref:Mediator complex subunit 15 KIX domain-containing protein n=1 Tax=Cudoniella acicularis TaxID=354080 RepID=A0A8H4VWN5_9HELO|nr:hypothetical protein G7Y89_g12805 [Cudoniella acicularis]